MADESQKPADDVTEKETQSDESQEKEITPEEWQSKYEEAIKHSREWEKRAKANKTAVDELEQLKGKNMTAEERAQAAEKRLAEIEATAQQNEWKNQVSKTTGVPADLLRGDSLEDMQAFAEAVNGFAHPKPKAPAVRGQDAQPTAKGESAERQFVKSLFGNN